MNSIASQAEQSPEPSIISNTASQCQPLPVPPPAPPQPPAIGGASKIDQYSRILFPVAFAGFNLVYWVVYLSKDTMEVSSKFSEYSAMICNMFMPSIISIVHLLLQFISPFWVTLECCSKKISCSTQYNAERLFEEGECKHFSLTHAALSRKCSVRQHRMIFSANKLILNLLFLNLLKGMLEISVEAMKWMR